ncbi:DUF1592 domain-containing protein [Sphingomonas tabacisoli]|uniref:DUF1592 domain-containing protein n=1 Tax=Sphingomonas tabacisoli TaxID=2249466 RepID=A0ABW4I5E4_9SPHN
MIKLRRILSLASALPLLLVGCTTAEGPKSADKAETQAALSAAPLNRIVGTRRLTETQYRNSIADIFGPDIRVAGRFEPIVRPAHELIASAAASSTISPTGFEQFDAVGRGIAAQVFGKEHRARFVRCTPRNERQADPDCAAKTLKPIGRYLFRRPMTAQEIAFYVKLAGDAATPVGSFYDGLATALAIMLVSPDFLYVVETAEPDPSHPDELRLDNFARASRLSFLLWNSTPNEALLQAAEQGRLTDSNELAAIAEHMIGSPRFEQGVRAFFSDLLLFEKFDEIAKDPIVYPRFNQEVAQALPEQMLRTIVDHLVNRDGDYRELFTTPRTFMTRSLGPLYGVRVHKPAGWEPFEFGPQDDRAGLLGQAGFLALYSHSGRSSPTLRGRAIRELLMCQPVPNPPGNVNFTAVQDTSNKKMPTARIRLAAHATDPVCAGCHKITDPLGLPLERFDGIGAFRATENETPIDVRGSLDNVSFGGAAGLGRAMATNPSTSQCVALRALEYAVGRTSGEDSTLAEAVEKKFAAADYRIRALFLEVATMPEAYRIKPVPLLKAPDEVAASGAASSKGD